MNFLKGLFVMVFGVLAVFYGVMTLPPLPIFFYEELGPWFFLLVPGILVWLFVFYGVLSQLGEEFARRK